MDFLSNSKKIILRQNRVFVPRIGSPNPNILIRELVDVSHPENFIYPWFKGWVKGI